MHPLNQGQQAALDSVIQFLLSPTERQMVIKGRAGTGKSTLVEHMIPAIHKVQKVISLLLKSQEDLQVHLCSTTNPAAKLLATITKEDVCTIHSLLGLTVKNNFQTGESKLIRRNTSEVIENALIVIDEAFSICPVLNTYIDQCTKNCKIIYIGDPYQCAPVRQTHSPIEDLQCRTEELTQVMRNKGAITLLSEHWRQVVQTGLFSPFQVNDPNVLYLKGNDFKDQIDLHYSMPNTTDKTNKIICWTNDQSTAYSNYVREFKGMPPTFQEDEYLQINNSLIKKGYTTDSIIRIKSLGKPTNLIGIDGRFARLYDGEDLFIPNSSKEYWNVLNEFKQKKSWREFYEIYESIPDLRSVHSCTVHKSQGSTYENVFIDLNDIGRCNIPSDVARIMHVAVSRPTNKIIFRGNLPAKYGG
jgi:energy-coupling factor transporter ATP-binding protein EcfA2